MNRYVIRYKNTDMFLSESNILERYAKIFEADSYYDVLEYLIKSTEYLNKSIKDNKLKFSIHDFEILNIKHM